MTDDLQAARLRKRTTEIVERARKEYGDGSPEVLSAKRIAFETYYAATHRHPDDPNPAA
jgi:hypothetical protein